MKKNGLTILILMVSIVSYAQNSMEHILHEIESNNTTLLSLQKQVEAHKLGNKSGIYLPNPEVEYTHLWGTPIEIGNESTFAITQSMDFPTAYGHRNKISNMQNQNLDLLYSSERINLLLQAKQLIINLTYYNALSKDYENRIKIAEEIAESYQRMFDEGKIDFLERNQVYMDFLTCINEKEKIDIERKSLLNELKTLNGGKEIEYESTVFILSPLPANFNEWYLKAESMSPILQYLTKQIEISKQQLKLNKALSLPKLSAGYVDERILGQKLQGVTIGVSIPLWENKNSVKQAKADIVYNETTLEDNKIQYYIKLQNLFIKSVDLQKTALKYRQALSTYNSVPILRKALEAGEITLLNYLMQIENYYDAYNNMLEVERDYALAEAELSAIAL